MSKYQPLKHFLWSYGQEHINMTFSEIEELLGVKLPQSAYKYNPWWANGGHSQAYAWLDAGYRTERINLIEQTVSFYKSDSKIKQQSQTQVSLSRTVSTVSTKSILIDQNTKRLNFYGYDFYYSQEIVAKHDTNGCVIKYYPQREYDNKKDLPLLYYGTGAFCRFSIIADDWPGVYLWIADSKIIYIGETVNLRRRFNMGYGCISPRNCYVGGQSTNCKMNKVILNLYEKGKTVSLYFYKTKDHKKVELELLKKIKTQYNVKDI